MTKTSEITRPRSGAATTASRLAAGLHPLPMLACLAGIAVVAFGFVTTGLLGRSPWIGLELLDLGWIFGAVAALALAGCALARESLRRLLLAAAGIGFVLAAAGPLATGSVCLVLLACYCLGDRLFGATLQNLRESGEIPAAGAAALAVLAGMVVLDTAIFAAARFPVNTPLVYLAAFTLAIAANPRGVLGAGQTLARTLLPAADRDEAGNRWRFILKAMLLGLLVIHATVALLPERGGDALGVHLFLASQIAAAGHWDFNCVDFVFTLMPAAGDWTFTAAYMLGGEPAAKLINLALMGSWLVLLLSLVARTVPKGLASLVALASVSAPLAVLVSSSAFVEHQLAALLLAGVVASGAACKRPEWGRVALAALLLGGAAMTKLHAVFVILPAALAFVWAGFRDRGPATGMGLALTAAAIGGAVGGAPYIVAWVVSGNPVFPFFNDVFRSPFYPPQGFSALFTEGLRWDTLFSMTFFTSRHLESGDGVLGFQYLALLPAALLAGLAVADATRRIAAVAFLVYVLGVLGATQYARYLFPVLPLGMFLVAGLLSWRHGHRSWTGQLGTAAAAGALALSVPLNLAFVPAAGWNIGAVPVRSLFDETARIGLVRAQVPARLLIDRLAETAGPDARVAIFGAAIGVGLIHPLARPPVFGNWYNTDFAIKALGTADAEAALALFAAAGVTHLIVTPGDVYLQSRGMTAVLERHVRELAREGALILYKLEAPGRAS